MSQPLIDLCRDIVAGWVAPNVAGDVLKLKMAQGYISLFEQTERQATNIKALYKQRREAERACELTRAENRRLEEQLGAARAEVRYLNTHLETCPQANLLEQLQAERKAWRKALDSAMQYVPLKDHDFIEAIVSNPERNPDA